MLNNTSVQPEKLTLKRILSVPCPRCRAKAKEKCTLSTGHPSIKTHADRELAAAKLPPPQNFGQSGLRVLKEITSRGLRVLFQNR
jgi:hypothetical protein